MIGRVFAHLGSCSFHARAFAVDAKKSVDVFGVEEAGVVVEVDVVAGRGFGDAGAFAVAAEEGGDVLGVKE